jgi:hypothetical protein
MNAIELIDYMENECPDWSDRKMVQEIIDFLFLLDRPITEEEILEINRFLSQISSDLTFQEMYSIVEKSMERAIEAEQKFVSQVRECVVICAIELAKFGVWCPEFCMN